MARLESDSTLFSFFEEAARTNSLRQDL
jgi:hypothetical protein